MKKILYYLWKTFVGACLSFFTVVLLFIITAFIRMLSNRFHLGISATLIVTFISFVFAVFIVRLWTKKGRKLCLISNSIALISYISFLIYLSTMYDFRAPFSERYQSLTHKGSIQQQDIPSDEIGRFEENKECAGHGEIFSTHMCANWHKSYYDNGQLKGYVAYKIKRNGNYYEEIPTYLISFYPDGSIHWLGDKQGMQYYNEEGEIIKVCDDLRVNHPCCSGYRYCMEYNKTANVWISANENWVY